MVKRLLVLLGLAGVLVACQQTPQAATGQVFLGILGGSPGNPTLMGLALDVSAASVTKEGEPYSGELLPGQVVQVAGKVEGARLKAASVDLKVELKGLVEQLDPNAGTLAVMGREVATDANTYIYEKGPGGRRTLLLSDLKVGDLVEVHGTPTPTGAVLATYIERYPASTAQPSVELKGQARNLDPGGMTFQLGGYTVDYSQAKVKGTPAEGAWVEVRGYLDGSLIRASKVEFSSKAYGGSGKMELEGPLSGLDPTAMTFVLFGFTVDYSGASVQGRLAEGAFVEVKGWVDANDPTLFRAERVKVKYPKTGVPSGEVKGPIASLDVQAYTFTVGSLGFYVDGATVLKRDDPDGPLAFEKLRVGDVVEVKYEALQDANGNYHALKVEVRGR
ncbi:hypothetical protein SAMN04488243_1822 [Thermus arciformis]|uniref:DUF5666 domain-containing protein n=1 Tax=Thermus arciformis TaxID=482827 RepID=A0A1G7LWP2_9DEIN|nr:DUF5666 domain-containing protein [Thermus arciformis]SDF53811.1 hypothetical protein SAMN04488243_1822 [Thermus arciformis]